MEENKNVEEKVETKKKKSGIVKILYWLVVIVGSVFIFLGSYKIGYKIGNFFSDSNKGGKSQQTKEEIKKASKDTYEFKFSDGGVPGLGYSGSINLKTGESKITVSHFCSTISGCGEDTPDEYEGTLEVDDLNKVIDFLENNNYPSFELVLRNVEGGYSLEEKTLYIIDFVKYRLEAQNINSLAEYAYEKVK